ncbi:uncharacterized protein LOC121246196 isoform X2 [Juglans microcarpa x Juglans regia]|uniref:uncharacterized protein LOC121246196 isoform X2 n=1 Tax=Juglans microcarpa x Juglans regia TaxID=2249226 RepID=UPI001B7E4F8E|nr:uncharacterized protein LOC121246196 isoform X2 [Juglans microcarpa x Juglans regia]
MGLETIRWVANSLEACLKNGSNGFYSARREGDRGFTAQRCSNSRGSYMALAAYGGGGRRSYILIPQDEAGIGWRKMMVVLKDMGRGGVQGRNPPQEMAVALPQRSYKEALEVPRAAQFTVMANMQKALFERGKYFE